MLRRRLAASPISRVAASDVRREVKLVFWTRTLWQDEPSMRGFMTRGAHRAVMPKILDVRRSLGHALAAGRRASAGLAHRGSLVADRGTRLGGAASV